jgi:two-component system response regulator MprA
VSSRGAIRRRVAGNYACDVRADDGHNVPLVLVAEDDRATRESLSLALELEGYRVRAVADGAEALAAVTSEHPAAIVIDVMMPRMDGLSVCRRLRVRGDRTPVLILTARTQVSDRVSGLDAGADDYLAKPFSLEELLARVRALMRRTGIEPGGGPLQVGDLRVDAQARRAWRGERELELTKTEFDLLEVLAQNAGIVLDHATIYDRIWGYDFGPDSKNLAVYVGYLRRKLEQDGEARLLHTVRGVGYTMREA